MKKKIYYLFTVLFSILFFTSSFAQQTSSSAISKAQVSQRQSDPIADPQMAAVTSLVNYQAVARDVSGNILANQAVGLRLTIEDGAGGPVLYQERQVPTTNQFGLFTVKLGNGTVLSGTWAGIDWSNGNQWLKVDMDPTGGNSYVTMGESELLAVPFANYAMKSGDNQWDLIGSDIHNTNTGDVNIGSTTSSGWLLHLHKDPYPEVHFTTTTTGQTSSDGYMLGLNLPGGQALVWNWEDEDILFGTNALERMRITNTGTTMFSGSITVGGNSTVTGNSVVNGTENVNGQSTILHPSLSGDFYTSAPLRVVSPNSTYYYSGMGFNTEGYGGLTLIANPSQLLVFDTTGNTYMAVTASAFNVSSDRSLKKEINNIGAADYDKYLNQIRNIEAITYLYNDENSSSASVNSGKNRVQPHVGFTAQSLPAAVQTSVPTSGKISPENKLGYNLSDMAGLTLVGVKALDSRQAQLEKEIEDLKAEIQLLKNK
jgi:hypothetical protein